MASAATTDNDDVAALLQAASVARGFALELGPGYTRVRSDDGRINVHTFTLGLRSTYRLTKWLTVFAGYAFFRQRTSSTPTGGAALAADADENRVSFGLQVGYPLRFDFDAFGLISAPASVPPFSVRSWNGSR